MSPGGERPGALRAAFGRRVRELRTRRGLTQRELARRAGMHPAYIGGIERGERNITLDGVERLARALEVRPAELMVPPGGDPAAGYEGRLRDLAFHAAEPDDLELALDVARLVLDRLHRRRSARWEAAEGPDEPAPQG